MHAVFLVCLFGGLVSTALFAALGTLHGPLHHADAGGHLHLGGHAHAGHLGGHAHGGQLAQGTGHAHALPQHTAAGHGHLPAQQGHPHHLPAQQGHAQHQPASSNVAGNTNLLATTLGWTLSWVNPLSIASGALWFGGIGLIAELAFGPLAIPFAIIGAIFGAALVRAMMAAFMRANTEPLHERAEGAIGEINAPIRADAPGEVIYTLEGLRRSAAARTTDGSLLPRGTKVVILRRERGIAWVSALDPLAPMADAPLLTPITSQSPDSSAAGEPRREVLDAPK